MIRRLPPLLTALLFSTSCVEAPFEHSNVLDSKSGVEMRLFNLPDTLFSAGDTFTVGFEMTPPLPEGFPDLRWSVDPDYALTGGAGHFTVSPYAGLLAEEVWVTVYAMRIRTIASGHEIPTVAHFTSAPLIVRRRPAQATVHCYTAGCPPLAILGYPYAYGFQLYDANGFVIPLPPNPYRFGTVVSRNTAVLTVSRPGPGTIVVTPTGYGSTWVVLTGEGLSDSTLVQVVP